MREDSYETQSHLARIRSAPLRSAAYVAHGSHSPADTGGVGIAMLSPSVAPDQSTSPLKKIHKCDGNSCIQLGWIILVKLFLQNSCKFFKKCS